MIKKSSIYIFIIVLCACSNTENNSDNITKRYFSIAQLLDEQVEILINLEAGLEKLVSSDTTTETLELNPSDSLEWKSQLRLFYDADISKPGNSGAYFVEELPAIGSLSKTIYTARKKKSFVRVMECTYKGELLNEVRLELAKQNEVFTLNQELFLYFNTETDQSRLSSFSITGNEAMMLKDEMSFDIKATVVLP